MSNNKTFAKILAFLNELNKMFGDKNHNIFNYYKVCKNTPISNQKAIQNHVTLFSNFLLPNKINIVNNDFNNFNPTDIKISDKTFINFKDVFTQANKDWRPAIFKHLQYLLYLIHPEQEVKQALTPPQQSLKQNSESSKETQVLNDFVEKLQDNFKNNDNKNPVELGLNLLKDGTFINMYQDINKSLQNGELKLDKLLGSVQNIIGELTQELPKDSTMAPASDLLNNMSSMLSNISSDGNIQDNSNQVLGSCNQVLGSCNQDNIPDLSQMMAGLTSNPMMSSMLNSMMGSMSSNPSQTDNNLLGGLDINSLLSTMGPMMSQMMGGNNQAEGFDMSMLTGLLGGMNLSEEKQE
jgi:hypothetical protein